MVTALILHPDYCSRATPCEIGTGVDPACEFCVLSTRGRMTQVAPSAFGEGKAVMVPRAATRHTELLAASSRRSTLRSTAT